MFVARGILNEEMFFETCGELLSVWEKVRPILQDVRKTRKNPLFLKYTEQVAGRYIDWVNSEAPAAYDWIVSLNRPQSLDRIRDEGGWMKGIWKNIYFGEPLPSIHSSAFTPNLPSFLQDFV